jgi:1,2-diacylglycerol 3-alpha-glucosyltransferase
VAYERFSEVIDDAFAYIGNATGLLEAAACGVPALVAIDSHPGPVVHGLFHETEGNDVGGYVPGLPEELIREQLLWLAQRTDTEYRELERASRARAEEFGLDRLMPRFLEILGSAMPFKPGISTMDRVFAMVDGVRSAALRKLGVPNAMAERHPRTPSREEQKHLASTA